MKIEFKDFELTDIAVTNGGTKWAARWVVDFERETPHSIEFATKDWSFNNSRPKEIFQKLAEHVGVLNKHNEGVLIFVEKLKLWKYGNQVAVKLDYTFKGSGEKESKGSTGKVLLSSQFYPKAEDVLDLILELEATSYDYLILGTKYEPVIEEVNFGGAFISFNGGAEIPFDKFAKLAQ